ncbi:MAG: hypothetical protein U1F23_03415 [Lysobacterales bacterium]
MRIATAAFFGAVVMFVWQFFAHMVLPIGEMGFRVPQNEDVVLQAVSTSLREPGIYYLPYIAPEKMGDRAALEAWGAKAEKNPYVFAVVNTPPTDPITMLPQLGKQFVTNFLGALLVAFVLAATAWTFGMRIVGALAIGVFGWLLNIAPMWNWYRLPADFMFANLIEQGVGWLLAGVAIAWWLGRRTTAAR